ncbi:hypothetical protein ACFVMC_25400 [Nocardia sp. NPDC127579]|uniref:hypothetical protein n=1 Tax=Nocardia sp. NPDC127579 TaxID=3345402 RepID=UPI003631E059
MIPGVVWGAAEAERELSLPCDELQPLGQQADRAISIDAPLGVVFGWLCQLRVAPYSYDLIDNLGRRSPTRRDPELTELEAGQRFMFAFRLHSFVPDGHLTMTSGNLAVTYAIRSEEAGTRLHVRLRWRVPRIAFHALSFGDLLMMRKQLRTLKELAEAEARSAR